MVSLANYFIFERQLNLVRGAARPMSLQWGSIRFRPLTRAYPPPGTRADELGKPRDHQPHKYI